MRKKQCEEIFKEGIEKFLNGNATEGIYGERECALMRHAVKMALLSLGYAIACSSVDYDAFVEFYNSIEWGD